MADNYLEKRMDDLRKVKAQAAKTKPHTPRPRSVLVVAAPDGGGREIAISLRKSGCRVAVFDSDRQAGQNLAYRHGIRFHHIDISDSGALEKETSLLLDAWREINIIVAKEEAFRIVAHAIEQWNQALPIPAHTTTEIIILKPENQ